MKKEIYIVMRSPVIMEDEGQHSIVSHYETELEAKKWIEAQEKEYFKPGDYYILYSKKDSGDNR